MHDRTNVTPSKSKEQRDNVRVQVICEHGAIKLTGGRRCFEGTRSTIADLRVETIVYILMMKSLRKAINYYI